jgi:hypothetical protein
VGVGLERVRARNGEFLLSAEEAIAADGLLLEEPPDLSAQAAGRVRKTLGVPDLHLHPGVPEDIFRSFAQGLILDR